MEYIGPPAKKLFRESDTKSPFTHIMLEPVTKTGSCVSEHEEPERAGDELSKSVLGSLIAQIEN